MEIRELITKMDAINLFSSLSPNTGFPPPLDSSSHTLASSDTAMSKLNSSQEALQQNTVNEGNEAFLRVIKPKAAQRSAPPRAVQNEEASTSPQPQRQWTSPPPMRVSVGARVLEGSVPRHVCLPLPLLFPVRCRAIRPRVKFRWCNSCNMIIFIFVGCQQAVEDPKEVEAANQQVVFLSFRSKKFAMRLYTPNAVQACKRVCMHTHCITLYSHAFHQTRSLTFSLCFVQFDAMSASDFVFRRQCADTHAARTQTHTCSHCCLLCWVQCDGMGTL